MARKRGSRKRQYRRQQKATIKVLGIAETLAMANLATNALFRVGIGGFLTNKVNNKTGGSASQITAAELFSWAMGGNQTGMVTGQTLGTTIQKNIQGVSWNKWLQLITIPLAFRIGKKVLAKPLINPANKLLRTAGVKELKI